MTFACRDVEGAIHLSSDQRVTACGIPCEKTAASRLTRCQIRCGPCRALAGDLNDDRGAVQDEGLWHAQWRVARVSLDEDRVTLLTAEAIPRCIETGRLWITGWHESVSSRTRVNCLTCLGMLSR